LQQELGIDSGRRRDALAETGSALTGREAVRPKGVSKNSWEAKMRPKLIAFHVRSTQISDITSQYCRRRCILATLAPRRLPRSKMRAHGLAATSRL